MEYAIAQGSDINEFDKKSVEQKIPLEENISDRTQEIVHVFNEYRNEDGSGITKNPRR